MTERQLIAIADPSARAVDCLKSKFRRFVHGYSTILTLNKSLNLCAGVPVWHASIAAMDYSRGRAVRIDTLADGVIAAMKRIALELLDGVGTGETFESPHKASAAAGIGLYCSRECASKANP